MAVQIRVAMSIIMALVKCSVFGPVPAAGSTGAGATTSSAPDLAPADDQTLDWGPPGWPSVGACQAAAAASGAGPERRPALEGSVGQSRRRSASEPAGCATRARQPFEIMNYFLQTCNGTASAHDAINGLQVSWRSFVAPVGVPLWGPAGLWPAEFAFGSRGKFISRAVCMPRCNFRRVRPRKLQTFEFGPSRKRRGPLERLAAGAGREPDGINYFRPARFHLWPNASDESGQFGARPACSI